jgi:hypothetical protein
MDGNWVFSKNQFVAEIALRQKIESPSLSGKPVFTSMSSLMAMIQQYHFHPVAEMMIVLVDSAKYATKNIGT